MTEDTEDSEDVNSIKQERTTVAQDLSSEETKSTELHSDVVMSQQSIPIETTAINSSILSTPAIPQIANELDNFEGCVRTEESPTVGRETSIASVVIQSQNQLIDADRDELVQENKGDLPRGKEATADLIEDRIKSVQRIEQTIEARQHRSILALPIDSLHGLASFLLPSEWSSFGQCSKASNRICREILKRVQMHGFRCATEVVTAWVSQVTHVWATSFVC